jgi:hypothetical protein
MAQAQDWCLHCGAGAPGALRRGTGLGSVAAVIAVCVVLVLGAAAAAYAALTEHVPRTPAKVASTLGASTTGAPVTPGSAASSIPPTSSTTGTSSTPAIPPVSSKPPKIPLSTPTPKSSGGSENEANNALFPPESKKSSKTTTAPTKTTGEATKGATETGSTEGTETKSGSGTEGPSPLLLDTDAASTYNPYNYPESDFGDPSLAIDDDSTTAWTAEVQPSLAPRMAEGLVIDLKSARRVARLELITSSPGLSFEVYGARGSQPPASITDPAWVQLHGALAAKKNTKVRLHESTKSFRFIVLWITKAPASSIGTPSQPGAVSVDELKLFPPAA